MSEPTYEWHVDVRRWDYYGRKVDGATPMTVLAPDRAAVTTKVRAAFNATFDDFRKFWSHDWTLREVREVPHATHLAAQRPTPATDRGELT